MLKIKDGIIGHAIGDAMGVPVEFCDRQELLKNPVTDMVGYGTYSVPAGTWSDDTSMEIALMDSFVKKKTVDYSMFNEETLKLYSRILQNDISKLEINDIKSSGYIVDTLEASLWSLLKTENYKDAVIKAINLGNDTDTIGAIVGSMAGILYRYNDIPSEWLNKLAKRDYLEKLCSDFETTLLT